MCLVAYTLPTTLSSYGVVVVRTPTFPDTFEYRKLAVISLVYVFVERTLPVTMVERMGFTKSPAAAGKGENAPVPDIQIEFAVVVFALNPIQIELFG
jgi:hypothetical protein